MTKYELQDIINNGGATLDKHGNAVDFSNGYQVSKIDGIPLDIKHLNKILKLINKTLEKIGADEFCGLWINEHGQMCVEISERIPRLYDAMRLGIERKQDSIFDWCTRLCFGCK